MTARRTEFSSLAPIHRGLAGNFGGQYHGWEMKAKQTKTLHPA